MSALLSLAFAASLFSMSMSGCKSTSEPSSSDTSAIAFAKANEVNRPAPGSAYRKANGRLSVYDSCKEEWIDTDLPYRESPTFPKLQVASEPVNSGKIYAVGDEKMQLFEVDGLNFDSFMKPGKANIPKSFRGIWWMDGNPLAETVVNFANAQYDKNAGTMTFTYNKENTYLVPSSAAGIKIWEQSLGARSTLRVRTPKTVDLDQMKFADSVRVTGEVFSVEVNLPLMAAIYFTDGLWRRTTFSQCYNLRRIVDEDGKKLPIFDYYAQKLEGVNRLHKSEDAFKLYAPFHRP